MYNIPNLEALENEDCLYLNIYTPEVSNITARL